jgi:uncharacterized membrane protein
MVYLAERYYAGSDSSFCNFSADFSCDIVNASIYSTFLGIPVALLGFGFFLAELTLMLQCRYRDVFSLSLYLLAFALTFSLTLTAVEIVYIGSICVVCELSKALMAVMIGVSAYGAGLAKEKIGWPVVTGAVGLGLACGAVVIFGS